MENESQDIPKSNPDKIVVFVPQDARLNFELNNQNPPTPKYNNRKQNIDIEVVKKIVGGEYGKQNNR
jgi:hypothetical protein